MEKKLPLYYQSKYYNKILEELDDARDVKAYDKAMSRRQEFVPLEVAVKEIEIARKKKK